MVVVNHVANLMLLNEAPEIAGEVDNGLKSTELSYFELNTSGAICTGCLKKKQKKLKNS